MWLCPLGCRVVALGEGRRDGHTLPAQPAQRFSYPAIPEACPPGEGMFVCVALRLLM
jgi:hypothetical protein